MNIQEVLNRVIEQKYYYQGYQLVSARLRGYAENPPIVKVEVVFSAQEDEQFERIVPLELFLMDAGFWIHYGRSMHWGKCCNICGTNCDLCETWARETDKWLFEWHKIIDLLAEGKYPGDYFSAL